MDDKACPKAKPLFASANEATLRQEEEKHIHDERNDFNVTIESSTLDAILAVQQKVSPKHFNTASTSNDKSAQSSSDDERNTFHDVEETISSDDEIKYPDKKRKRSKESRKKKKKKKHKHRSHQSPSPEPVRREMPRTLSHFHKNKVFIDDMPDLRPEDAFHIDRKANQDLRKYQSVSKLHISKYRLASNVCVGNPKIRVDHRVHDPATSRSLKKQKMLRYFGKQSVRSMWTSGISYRSNPSSSQNLLNQPDYITIPKEDGAGNRNNNAIGDYSCLDEATSLYIQGKGKLPSTESDSLDDIVMDGLFHKVAEFNQKTREDPHNVDLWLEFVKFQDVAATEDKSFRKKTLHLYDIYRPSKLVIEKKLSILEKAIELNPSALPLRQAQLGLYQDVWETDKVEKAWEDLLFVHASNVDLWRHYLSRQQSRLSTFSFNKMVRKYHKCFKTLVPILEGQVKVANKMENLEEKLLGVFHQYCSFLHQSGYTERAVASFQAMIELNLFCPPALNLTTTKERIGKFEAFWDSSAPKFGDRHAKGWTAWEKNKEDCEKNVGFLPESTEVEEDSIIAAGLSKSLTWLKMEKARRDVYWLPWKPDVSKGETEESCEDPDRLVLFEDINPALFRLTKSQGCLQLVCLLLSFLGMNSDRMETILSCVDGIEKSSFTSLLFDQMHQIPSASCLIPSIDVDAVWRPHSKLVEFITQVILQAENYFGSSSHRDLFTLLRIDLKFKKNGTSSNMVISAGSGKEIKKFGKNLLKESQNRNNLVLWDAYIRLLWFVSDNMEETVSMIDTALGMFLKTISLTDMTKAKGICLLCRTYAEIMLNFEPLEHVKLKGRHMAPSIEDKQQVIGCMSALVEDKKFKPHSKVDSSPLCVLRIRKRMEKVLKTLISSFDDSSVVLHTCEALSVFVQCFCLFEFSASDFATANKLYLTTKRRVWNCFSEGSSNLAVSYSLKSLHVAHTSFISNVMHIQSVPLSYLRSVSEEAIEDFPENGHFHKEFLEIEAGSFLVGRLRKFYDKRLRNSPSLSSVVFAAVSELMRLETLSRLENIQADISDTGLIHRIRSLFEHTLELPICTHCPLLWRMWLTFEINHGTKAGAKGILYRALQSCPWAKCIYIDGVKYFGDEELNEMSDLMTEKEIRVYMPLEEVDLLLNAEKEESDLEEESQELV